MRVLSIKTLSDYWVQHADSEQPLKAWYAEAKAASWKTSHEVVQRFRSADPIGNNRVVFNISGNKYRLVVGMNYTVGICFIKFIGTHAEYDKIDAETV
ncbi:type II toxin-antitoxin system HigB family toxin [Aeromonas salmonicida]|uniref:type II toxin-antitoxin system HigB family toxin n=1 Tax=Aeromonas salmonicida TaxID=645 RepID=UPI003D2575F3